MAEIVDFQEDKWVLIMCDYSAEGISDRDGVSRCIDLLPITEDLKKRVMAWQEWYELYDPHERPPVEIDWNAFAAEGLAISREIKKALPDWTVVYHDESTTTPGWKPGMPRDHREYEITADSLET